VKHTLERVKLAGPKPVTTAYLDCDNDVLWSVGSKHLVSTRDGEDWKIIPGATIDAVRGYDGRSWKKIEV